MLTKEQRAYALVKALSKYPLPDGGVKPELVSQADTETLVKALDGMIKLISQITRDAKAIVDGELMEHEK